MTGNWPREGGQAFCLLADVRSEKLPAPAPVVLKIFKRDVAGRGLRNAFLVRSPLLTKFGEMFQEIPFASLDGVVIENVAIFGNLTKQIASPSGVLAENFWRYKMADRYDQFSMQNRRQLITSLIVSVQILERFGFAHGDLSDRNAMIARGRGSGEILLCLCDFDAFDHALAPRLALGGGSAGTPGYRHGFMLDAGGQRAGGRCARNDRFALAVLAFELMVWDREVSRRLGRVRLLTDEVLPQGRITALDLDVAATRWPEGFGLLERAVAARDWNEMAAPEDWLDALGVRAYIPGLPFRGIPYLISRPERPDGAGVARRAEIRHPRGTLGPIDGELAEIGYVFEDRCLTFSIPPGAALLEGAIHTGPLRHHAGPAKVSVGPGGVVAAEGWRIEVHDGGAH